ncbi:hypothetical protein C8R43DRAFT_954289 [Mycena crocata]|nr:hypothetical protein C8R43DRAFT_954289 [Mycena crocata]
MKRKRGPNKEPKASTSRLPPTEEDGLAPSDSEHDELCDDAEIESPNPRKKRRKTVNPNIKPRTRRQNPRKPRPAEEYWPVPTARDFLEDRTIAAPYPIGARSRQKMLSRPGRGVCRIMIQYMQSCNSISRIFGVAHNPVVRAVNNEYSPPDNTSSDYEEAGGEFSELFPPREAGAEEPAQQQLLTNEHAESEADAPEADAPEADTLENVEDAAQQTPSTTADDDFEKSAEESGTQQIPTKSSGRPDTNMESAADKNTESEVETMAQAVIVKSDVADHEGTNIASQQLPLIRGSNKVRTLHHNTRTTNVGPKATPILITESSDDDEETIIQRPSATEHEVFPKAASADAAQQSPSERPFKAETKVDVVQRKEHSTTDVVVKEECDDGAVTQFLQSIPDYDFSQLHATFMEKGVKSRKQLKTLAEDFNDDERLAALKDMLKNVSHFDRILLSKGLRSFNSS